MWYFAKAVSSVIASSTKTLVVQSPYISPIFLTFTEIFPSVEGIFDVFFFTIIDDVVLPALSVTFVWM